MKLLFCLFHYFPYGGLQRDCIRIAQACIHAGDQVDIITQIWEGPRIPGITVHCFPVRALTNHGQCQKFSQKVQTFLKTHDYDAVIGFNKMPGLDIYYAADPCYQENNQGWRAWLPRNRAYIQLEKAVFDPQKKTTILLLNPSQENIFSHYYHTQPERFHLLPPGIDPSRRVAQQVRAHTDQNILLFLASGFKAKGLDRALVALASLPQDIRNHTQLWIAGQDSLEPYQAIIKKYNLSKHIKFLGAVDNVPELLLSVDLLLHPAYKELAGMVLLEALVAGVPVLTTQVCGYAHYVQESGAGVVIPEPFSQTLLNQQLAQMLSSKNQLELFREKAYQFSQTADVYRMPSVAVQIIHQHLTVVS